MIKTNFILLFTTLVLLCSANVANCQPTLLWERNYGIDSIQEDLHASVKLNQNLYVHGGNSTDFNTAISEPFLLFTNANGDSLYNRKILNVESGRITGMAVHDAGSFVACGAGKDSIDQWSLFFFKADHLGNILWKRHYYGADANVHKVIALPDGYLIITDKEVSVLKTDLQGNQLWQKRYWPLYQATAKNIMLLPDGSYLAVGATSDKSSSTVTSFYKLNYLLLKMKPNGDTIFSKILGSPTDSEMAYAAKPTSDGGYIMSGGYTQNTAGARRQGTLIKLDSLFNIVWEERIMPPRGRSDLGCDLYDVQETTNGDFIVMGDMLDSIRNNGFVAKYNATGMQQWQRLYTSNMTSELFKNMLYEDDGSAVFAGYLGLSNSTNGYLVRLSNLGQPYKPNYCASPPAAHYSYTINPDSVIFSDSSISGTRYGVISKWEFDFGDNSNFITYDSTAAKRVAHKYAIPAPLRHGMAVKLIVTNNLGCTDTVTLYPFGGGPNSVTEATAQNLEVKLYPNPMQEQATLELKNYSGSEALTLEVTDILGRPVQLQTEQTQPGQWKLERGSLSSGLYLYRVTSASKVVAQGRLVINN